MFYSFLRVIPALFGLGIASLVLWYFVCQKSKWGIVGSSFFFLLSGFLFQMFLDLDILIKLEEFAHRYRDIFSIPVFTIFATSMGIFLGNTLLKYYANNKEKREVGILFINSINSQITIFYKINSLISMISIQNNFKEINSLVEELSKEINSLAEDIYYDTAFKKIGIYSDEEIDLISKYSISKRECIKKALSYSKSNPNLLPILKFILVHARIYGMLCVFELNYRYCKNDKVKINQEFVNDCSPSLLYSLFSLNSYLDQDNLLLVDQVIVEDFIKRMKYVQDRYRKMSVNLNQHSPIYLCYILLDPEILPQKTGLSNFVNLQNTGIKEAIVSISSSQEDSQNKCKKKFEVYLKHEKNRNLQFPDIDNSLLNQLIENLGLKTEIISPWT